MDLEGDSPLGGSKTSTRAGVGELPGFAFLLSLPLQGRRQSATVSQHMSLSVAKETDYREGVPHAEGPA
jgi:hypothetical protein